MGESEDSEAVVNELPCKVCNEREVVAGVYCQPCLDRETANMTMEELGGLSPKS
jgi:hypothetical protein